MVEDSLYRIVLLRHAESTGNSTGLFQGHSDFELSEKGLEQARRLAGRWRKEEVKFDKIISSPLLRARQTAEVIAGALDTSLVLQPEWMERDIGSYTGKPSSEIVDLFPQSPYTPIGQSGESQWSLYLRAGHAVQELLRLPPGRYLVVAHGGILNFAIHAMFGIPPSAGPSGPRFILANAAFAKLTYSPGEHAWRLFSLNDHKHLDEDVSNEVEHSEENLDAIAVQAKKAPSSLEGPSPEGQLSGQSSGYAKHSPSSPPPPSRFTIRQATPTDIPGILETIVEVDRMHADQLPHIFKPTSNTASNQNFYKSLLSEHNTKILVAETNGEIAGALHAYIQESSNYPLAVPRRFLTISTLTVKAVYRRLGIGAALVKEAHAWALKSGLRTVELTVWEFNESARLFYEKLGYQTANRKMWINLEEGS